MAAVVVTSTIAEWLPLAGVAALSLMLYRRDGHKSAHSPEHKMSAEDEIDFLHQKDLEVMGMSQATFQVQHDKHFTAGGHLGEDLSLDNDNWGYNSNPNVDVLEMMRSNHAQLARWDRSTVHYTLNDVQQSSIRPFKRVPIAVSLTPEIHHPNDPTARSRLEDHKLVPNDPTDMQVRRAMEERAKADEFMRNLRYHDTEYFSRAPGQSFRYE